MSRNGSIGKGTASRETRTPSAVVPDDIMRRIERTGSIRGSRVA